MHEGPLAIDSGIVLQMEMRQIYRDGGVAVSDCRGK